MTLTEVIVSPPSVENRDFGYFDSPPVRRLQARTARDGHVFQSILTSPNGDVFVNWRPAQLAAGRYEVAVFVPSRNATTTLAKYFVHGIVGRSDPEEHVVNQSVLFDTWAVLGAFDFDPARNPDIFVDAQNASIEAPPQEIAYDAVRWRPIVAGGQEIPWVWPVLDEQRIIGHPFNEPRPSFGANHLHEGADIRAGLGKRVVAAVAGTVITVHRWDGTLRGSNAYGNHVVVEQDPVGGYKQLYAHLNDFVPGLREGQHVAAGQMLGFAGSTGNSTRAHLHVSLTHPTLGLDGYVLPKVLDPAPYLLNSVITPGASMGGIGSTASGTTTTITNQDAINQLFKLAPSLGMDGALLLDRLNWNDLAVPSQNRNLDFDRNRLKTKPAGIGDAEWGQVVAKLNELFAPLAFARMPEGFHALPGVHGPADPGDFAWTDNGERGINGVRQSGVQAVKVLVPEIQGATLQKLMGLSNVKFVMARLFAKMDARRGATMPERVQAFLNDVDPVPAGDNGPMMRAFKAGVRYFEVHNEPNLSDEGLGINWNDGREFADFFTQVVARLRQRFHGAKFGFPGCSPGDAIPGRREVMDRFLMEAAAAVRLADFMCCHVYWGGDGSTPDTALRQLEQFCRKYPDKIVLLTEFSHNGGGIDKAVKGDQYRDFYRAIQTMPPNLGAAFSFCLSSTGTFQAETWIEKNGTLSGIVPKLGLM
jgi:murein DD-endopeptidase MepM/ murein hydrolase activator NlpD